MLGCNDNALHPGVFDYPSPLAAIERGRVEVVRTHTALAPFLICKCIHSEMDECVIFQLLPFELLRRRQRQDRLRRRELRQKTEYEKYGLIHLDWTNCRAARTITQSLRFAQLARASALESHRVAKGKRMRNARKGLMPVDRLLPMGVESLHAKEGTL